MCACYIGLYAPPNKQNILYNICRPTMLHKCQSCTNVIQMFCVHWAVMKHLFCTYVLKARFIANSTRRVAIVSLVNFPQPACRVYFPLHPARYEPVSTYLGLNSRRPHVPFVRNPPSLDIKANRNAPAIIRHRLAWEHQAK